MTLEVLMTGEMGRADRLATASMDSFVLMRNAGRAVADAVLSRMDDAVRVHVLCGPGNNGGDGYVAAGALIEAGRQVVVHARTRPRRSSDAWRALEALRVEPAHFDSFAPEPGDVVIDALYGAGLSRSLEDADAAVLRRAEEAGCRIVAVDLPSGLSGDDGQARGHVAAAELTVTFFRRKPAHLLYPGRALCGDVVVADIGIPATVLGEIAPACLVNDPLLWQDLLPAPAVDSHKYARGTVRVFSGGPASTGAARLAAMGAQRAGAGAVSVLSPAAAMLVHACHLTSIMLARVEGRDEVEQILQGPKRGAFVLGPGFGVSDHLRDLAVMLAEADHSGLVIDADAITAIAAQPRPFFGRRSGSPLVMTPHEGEFRRMFPDLGDEPSKLLRARKAAAAARAVLLYKGPDTVVAAPDGRAVININATPALATAGSGDVLAGIVAALMACRMPAFEAASAAVWLHAEAGRIAGPQCIAEDLPSLLPQVFRQLPPPVTPQPGCRRGGRAVP